jgi:hypothetical protein
MRAVAVVACVLLALLQACSSTSASPEDDAPAPAIDGGTGTSAEGGGAAPGSDGGAGDAGSTAHDAAPPGDADTSSCPAQTEAGVTLSSGTSLARALVPNPIVSLGRPVTTTTGGYDATQLFAEPRANAQAWQPANGESVTIDIGAGPSELLVVWQIDYPDYVSQGAGFGLPYSYAIDVSPDGSSWTSAAGATTTSYRSREMKFSFSGQSRVRFTMKSSGSGTLFRSMKIFDVSNGSEDTWLVAGMGPSRFVYDDLEAPSFGKLVSSCRPKYYPALINISDLSPSISDFVTALDAPAPKNWLLLNPDFHFWILTYGLGDLGNASAFSSSLESAVKKLLAAGRVPVLTHVQYVAPGNGGGISASSITPLNAAIDALVAKYGLMPSPDMYGWFQAHSTELCSAADTNDPSGFCGESQWNGIQPINVPSRPGVSDTIRLWAAAATAAGAYAH